MRAPPAPSRTPDSAGEPPSSAAALPNAAISLCDLLGSIQQTLRALPRAWVRAEVQKVSISEKVSSIELIETDAAGRVVAKARVKFWRARWQEVERRFAGAHQPTLDYVRRRTAEGKSKLEIIRCLKRFVAREIFGYLCRPANAQHSVLASP